jgi:hypothetical protein
MGLTGHKTRAGFEHYNIVRERTTCAQPRIVWTSPQLVALYSHWPLARNAKITPGVTSSFPLTPCGRDPSRSLDDYLARYLAICGARTKAPPIAARRVP